MRCEAKKKTVTAATRMRFVANADVLCMRIVGEAGNLGSEGGKDSRAYDLKFSLRQLEAPQMAIDCRMLLGQSLKEVCPGRLWPQLAHAIALLAGIFLRAADQGDLEQRVRELEDLDGGAQCRKAEIERLEEETQPDRQSEDISIMIQYFRSERDEEGAVRDVAIPIVESEYETSDWRELKSGDRIRVRDRFGDRLMRSR